MVRITLLGLLVAIGILTGCRKEVEKLVVQQQVVEKQYSWTQNRALLGNFNILLGVGKGPNGLYFQQPTGFAALEQKGSGGALTYTQYLYPSPTDILVRLPLGPDFFVSYTGDSLVWLVPNVAPVTNNTGALIRLRRLDPLALRVQRNAYTFNKFGAINKDGYLLFPYESAARDNQNHLVLAHVTLDPAASLYYPKYRVTTQLLTLPITGGIHPYTPQLVTAIDDYFLVDCGTEGAFKITESGQARQVLPAYTGVDQFFKYRDQVCATLDGNRFAVSANNGDTWRIATGAPSMLFTTLHPIGDSLVAVYHGIGGNMFTLNYDPTFTRWRIRPLKDDGLNQTDINGLETWADTVYLATSSGLYKRPLSKFFESK